MKPKNKFKNSFNCLKVLAHCNRKMRKSILENADRDLVNSICECVLNVLIGNVKLDDQVICNLEKHKTTLRKLLKQKDKRKQILVQKGGFIQYLIPPLIQVIADLITDD